jgi:hypothetical protein
MTAIASVLAGHVAFQLDSVDRLFIAGYVPGLQHEGGVVRFLIERGYRIPSPAGLGHNHDRLVADIEAFVAERAVPLVRFGKGESKEERARPYLADAEQQGREGVVLVGKAQERVAGWRGFKDRSSAFHSEGHPHFTYRRQALFVDHFYFYIWDEQWGPGFIKLCPYAPYGVWAWLNGHLRHEAPPTGWDERTHRCSVAAERQKLEAAWPRRRGPGGKQPRQRRDGSALPDGSGPASETDMGATQVNQRQSLESQTIGSNLADVGRVAAHAHPLLGGRLRCRSVTAGRRPRGRTAAYPWRGCRGTAGHLRRRPVAWGT